MIKIRLARAGAKKRPYYHIVVTDKESPRDGRFIEHIGTFDPGKPDAEATVRGDRLEHWLGVGAQMTPRVAKVVRAVALAAEASA